MTDYSRDEVKRNKSERRLLKYAVFAFLSVFFVYSLIVCWYASENVYFAERYSSTVAAFFRKCLALLSGFVPFSIAETLAIVGSVLFLFLLVRALVLRLVYKVKGRVAGFFFGLICVVFAASGVFINTFGVCYKRLPVSERLGLDTESVTDEDVFITAYLCSSFASGYCDDVSRYPDGETYMDYSFDEMVDKILGAYREILTDTPDFVSVKPVALSEPWTYTHISGMYFPMTGESNINMNFPDYILAFTVAHEIAHQLGIADETDANMMAFLVCAYSEDYYLTYSAYMNALSYLLSDLDARRASLLYKTADRRIIHEMSAYYSFMSEYDNRTVSSISNKVNDTYLKANGESDGTKSYGKVTRLICGFMKKIYREYY